MYRSTWTLLILVMILAVSAVLVHRHGSRFGERASSPLDFDAGEVSGLEIHNRHARIALRWNEDEWWVVEPFLYPADTLKIARLVHNLESIRTSRPLPGGETPPTLLEKAGLTSGEARFVLQCGDREVRGRVGKPPRLGPRSFMAVEGRQGVFTFVSRQAALFFDPPDAFRDPRALRFEASDLTEIRLETASRRIVLREKAPDSWILAEPSEGPVHPDALAQVKGLLRRLRVITWVASANPDPGAFGLETPARIVAVGWGEGDRPAVKDELLLGKPRNADERFGRRSASASVFTVDRENVKRLFDMTVERLRDLAVVRFREAWIDRIEIGRSSSPAEVWERSEDGWRMRGGGSPGPNRWKALFRLLAAFSDPVVARFASLDAGLDTFGLSSPRLVIRIVSRGGRGEETLAIGGTDDRFLYLRRGTEAIVLGVNKKAFRPLLAPFLEAGR